MITKEQVGAEAAKALFQRLEKAAKKAKAPKAYYIGKADGQKLACKIIVQYATDKDRGRTETVKAFEDFPAMIKDAIGAAQWALISMHPDGKAAINTVEIALIEKIKAANCKKTICRPCGLNQVEFLGIDEDGKPVAIDMSDFV